MLVGASAVPAARLTSPSRQERQRKDDQRKPRTQADQTGYQTSSPHQQRSRLGAGAAPWEGFLEYSQEIPTDLAAQFRHASSRGDRGNYTLRLSMLLQVNRRVCLNAAWRRSIAIAFEPQRVCNDRLLCSVRRHCNRRRSARGNRLSTASGCPPRS